MENKNKTITNDIKILTPSGFQNFDGIKRYWHEKYLVFTFKDDTKIKTTFKHKFIIDNKTVYAQNVKINQNIGKVVKSIEIINSGEYFYDPINVKNGSIYNHDNSIVSHNTFFGKGNTLISPDVLMQLKAETPTKYLEQGDMKIYDKPNKDHTYIIVCDVCKGRGQDNSAMSVIDITTKPFKQVAVYRNNVISPLLFPDIIYKYAILYNNAYVIVESNDQGCLVTNALYHELEYENMHMSHTSEGGRGKISTWSVRANHIGIETNKKIKRIGCSSLKDIIESYKLQVVDENTIVELSTFVSKGNSYEADDDSTDDIVMTLVLFSYFISSQGFENLTEINIRKFIYERKIQDIEEDVPVAFIYDDGMNEIVEEPYNPGEDWSVYYDEDGYPMV